MIDPWLCSPAVLQGKCIAAAFVFAKVFLDFPLSPAIIDVVDNSIWSTGACSRFSFSGAAISATATAKQAKTCPLESISYELQFL
jgi:hypothetical protein